MRYASSGTKLSPQPEDDGDILTPWTCRYNWVDYWLLEGQEWGDRPGGDYWLLEGQEWGDRPEGDDGDVHQALQVQCT